MGGWLLNAKLPLGPMHKLNFLFDSGSMVTHRRSHCSRPCASRSSTPPRVSDCGSCDPDRVLFHRHLNIEDWTACLSSLLYEEAWAQGRDRESSDAADACAATTEGVPPALVVLLDPPPPEIVSGMSMPTSRLSCCCRDIAARRAGGTQKTEVRLRQRSSVDLALSGSALLPERWPSSQRRERRLDLICLSYL